MALLSNDDMTEPIIRKTWTSNKYGSILTSIPNELAEKHGIKIGSNLVFEDKPDCITIKKLVIA